MIERIVNSGRAMQGVPPSQGIGQPVQPQPQHQPLSHHVMAGHPSEAQSIGGSVYQGGATSPFGGPVVYAQPPSQAAKVIGILLMVYGGFSVLSGILSAVGGGYLNEWITSISEPGAEEYLTPTWVYTVQGILGALTGAAYIYSGWLIQSFKKKGIWFAWGLLGFAYLMSIIMTAVTPYPSSPDLDGESLRLISVGSTAVCGLFGAAFCGLILAIPLMISNNGME